MNPIQLVEQYRLYIPHIRKDEIIWFVVHMATLNNQLIKINLPEWKMMDVVQFRHAKRIQFPFKPIEHIGSDTGLLRYLSGARKRSFESFDGGVTWKEVDWTGAV